MTLYVCAEAGLIFMDELNRVAQSLQTLRGTLSRRLLPYDHNTAISDQISTVHQVVAAMPAAIRGKLTEKQVQYLVSGLNSVRQLVRVKIADDNDLEQVCGGGRRAVVVDLRILRIASIPHYFADFTA
jgi:hypothetical protein